MENFNFREPDYASTMVERGKRLAVIQSDPQALAAAQNHYAADNIADWIEDWLFTYDPRRADPTVPMLLWAKQKEYLDWLLARYRNREDGLVEKTRDAGASWLCCAFAAWCLLYKPGSKISIGSRKEKLVDEPGNMDSLFEKIRFILRMLPKVLLPEGLDPYKLPYMKLANEANGAVITGEAGDNIGRGGRSSLYFVDEAPFLERPDRVDAALSQNSDCKIYVGTPNGPGNPFYRRRVSGKVPVFVFDWRDDPRKDQVWYDRQVEILEPWVVAQEIDRDYAASRQGVAIPAPWVNAAIGLELSRSGLRTAALDVANDGGDANCLIERQGVVVDRCEVWLHGNTTESARRAWGLCQEHGVDILLYDSIGVGAGIRGEESSLRAAHTARTGTPPALHVQGINTALNSLPGAWCPGKTNADMFTNLRALLWWGLRRRFERTFEHVNGIRSWPDDELISIPADSELRAELSTPGWTLAGDGRILIESKKDMASRGVRSPNRADALVMLFAPPQFVGYNRLGAGRLGKGAVR